ncbi:MAG: TonB-dependent receptor [Ignavibacteriales bacterium]|nr:TonB-dependent receptor [Ignavibacteriales bacterium]MCF8306106.1 TonB-dependent receptor [Ignavibacteriales bacterium]MCF8315839.1 TonB-dependent receptor [Ignavibacteriales bacterium]MCF8437299.1 TonB-dependent receptor [Ignavibacteriales bacterium]
MKKNFVAVCVLLMNISFFAQTVTVLDKATMNPLPAANIYSASPKASAVTDAKGEADVSAFRNASSIVFSYVGYKQAILSYEQLRSIDFRVIMTESLQALDEVVVSANKFEEKLSDIPQQIQVLKARQIENLSQQTTADVLQHSSNILVQKSQLGGGSPVIRGFETNKVLMVVDGVRMNNAIYRGGHLQNVITLDNAVMDKIEVVFGPGSVIYGSDALGGVMHFYTKNPVLCFDNVWTEKVNAFTRYSSAYDEKTGHIDFSLGNDAFGSLTSFTYSDFGDLVQGSNRNPFYGDWGKRLWYSERFGTKDSMVMNADPDVQKKSGYKQYDFLQKFLFRQSTKISHVLNFQYSTSSDIPRYDRLTVLRNGKPRFAEWYYGPQERFFTAYTLNLVEDSEFYDNARFIAGYQNVKESRHDRSFNNNRNNRTEKLDIFTFNADLAKKIEKHEIRFGLDGWYNKVNSTAELEDILTGARSSLDTRYPDGGSSMSSIAAYISHAYEFSDNLILNDGLRINYVQLDAKFNDKTFFPFPFSEVSQKNTAVNGNLGVVFSPRNDWRFTMTGATGFRAPNVDDLSKVFESVQGSVIIPNPDLEPEYTYNLDLGIQKTIDGEITLGGNAYYTWYRNAITVQPGTFAGSNTILYDGVLSNVITTVNAAKAYLYGFSIFLNADISDNFSISNSVNYTYGRIETDTTDYPLDHIPPVFGRSSFLLKLNKFTGEFFVMYNGAKNAKDYNLSGEDNQAYSADPVNGYTPAWYTLNLRAGYQINQYLRIQLALENILDQNYRQFASNIGAPGRNLVLTLRGSY